MVGQLLEILTVLDLCTLEEAGLIRNNQCGFVQGYPASLIDLFEEATAKTDKGRAVDVIGMDFNTAAPEGYST